MKRTPLKRKTPLRAKVGLKPGGRLKPRSTSKRSMGKPDPRWRSRKYLDWVKTLPCVMCGAPADDPHHIKGIGNLSGAGLTAPDGYALPVCRSHHEEIHQNPDLWPMQFEWVARTLNRALAEGVLVVGK